MRSIVVRRLRTGSIYRLSAIGAAYGLLPLFTLFGILASVGLFKLTWNNEVVTGPRALIVGPLMGALFALICIALFGSSLALGLWIYSKFRPLSVEYEELPEIKPLLSTDG
jgi:hypothetical protein